MDDLQQPTGVGTTPTPTPTPPPQPQPTKPVDNSKGIAGMVLGIIGFFFLGIPLGIAAIVLGITDEPKTAFSWTAIVVGVVDIIGVLVYLS